MAGRDRRTWTAEQKLQAVMPILRGEVSLSEQTLYCYEEGEGRAACRRLTAETGGW